MTARDRMWTVRRQVVGALFLVAILAFLATTVAMYEKAFTPVVHVLLRTDHVGNQLQPPSDVKIRGLVVGEVREVRAKGDGAELDLALQPDKVGLIPANVMARLLPKTLFGERYVSLVPPGGGPGRSLADGDVIDQDHSKASIELEKVLTDVMPLLRAVPPEKLAGALNSVSMALDGRGKDLGETLVATNRYLETFNQALPELRGNITALANVSRLYAQTTPDLLQALHDFAVNDRTVAENRAELSQLYSTVTTASNDLDGFLLANRDTIIGLNAASRPQLALFARYSPEFPCLLHELVGDIPRADQVAGKGTDTPGVIRLHVQTGEGGVKYLPGRDDPRYEDTRGPRCYNDLPVPFPASPPGGGPPRDGTGPPPRGGPVPR